MLHGVVRPEVYPLPRPKRAWPTSQKCTPRPKQVSGLTSLTNMSALPLLKASFFFLDVSASTNSSVLFSTPQITMETSALVPAPVTSLV